MMGASMKIVIPALAGLILLAGCVSGKGSAAVHPLSAGLSAGSRVTAVRVSHDATPGVDQAFRDRFAEVVQGRLDHCATGSTPLTVEVSLDGFEGANPGMALLFPSQSRISGTARMRDASGAVVGEYRIQRSLTIGGLAGAWAASTATSTMSGAFGDELCKQAFTPGEPVRTDRHNRPAPHRRHG